MFKPEIKVVEFEMIDVITTSVDEPTQPACPTNTALPCLAD